MFRLVSAITLLALAACDVPIETFHYADAGLAATLPYPDGLTQRTYVKAFNTNANALFGFNVALSADGETMAVAARDEASATQGINGNPFDLSAAASGAVYIFTRTGATWTQEAYLKASNTGATDRFGSSLALSADGSLLAVGAPMEDGGSAGINGNDADDSVMDSGAVYVFTRLGPTWRQPWYVKAAVPGAGDQFGASVAVSSDGMTLAVGAVGESSNASGVNGVETDNSLPTAGAAYVFTLTGGTWAQQAYVKAAVPGQGDSFGNSVSLSGDGATLAVGARFEDGGGVGVKGDPTSNTCANAGAAYVFTRTGAAWSQQAYLKASNTVASSTFGGSVRLSRDGSTLAVGATGESSKAIGINGDQSSFSATDSGAVYLFVRAGATWAQQAFIKASNAETNDFFASSLALSADGSILAVGAAEEDGGVAGINRDQGSNTVLNSGAVYLFTRGGALWGQNLYIKASNPINGGDFAEVALSDDGTTLAVGADGDSSAARTIDGNQADQSAASAGAVYVFR